jgi:hypothetical protein
MVVGRWWLLTLPAAMAAGASHLLLMPGTRIDGNNPVPFLLPLLQGALILGILARRRLSLHAPTR